VEALPACVLDGEQIHERRLSNIAALQLRRIALRGDFCLHRLFDFAARPATLLQVLGLHCKLDVARRALHVEIARTSARRPYRRKRLMSMVLRSSA
jgi:hypothetical protein